MSFNRGGIDPYNPPFVVNVNVDRDLQEFAPLFTGFIMNHVESTSNKNGARRMFFELMQQDENALAQMINELAQATQYAVDCENLGRNQVELAIRNLVPTIVNGYVAMAVDTYPQQFGPHLDQQMSQEVSRYMGKLNELRQQIQQFYNQGRSGTGWGSQNTNANYGGGNRAAANRGGGGWSRNANTNTNYGNARPSRWDEDGGDGSNYIPASQDRWPGNRMGNQGGGGGDAVFSSTPAAAGGGNLPNANSKHARPAREFVVHRGRRADASVAQAPEENARVSIVDGQRFYPPAQHIEWPRVVNDQRVWDWILMEDGSQLRPAYQSTWQVSFNPETPVTPWFDTQTHILFHHKDANGVVTERILEREPTMEYLDHELDPNLRRISKQAAEAREGKAAPAWDMVEKLRSNPSSPLATAEPLSDDAEAMATRPINPTDFMKTTSLADAIKRASVKLKVEHPGILNEAFELYVDRAVLTTVIDPDFDMLFNLANADSFEKLFHLLTETDIGDELAAEVDGRIVGGINEAMTCHMGLRGWAITSFRDDFGDLLSALKEDYGMAVVDYLKNNSIEIISRWLAHYSEKDLSQVRDVVGVDETLVPLVWRERNSVTRLPITAEQVRIPVDTGVMISSVVHPEMYKTLSAVFVRTEDIPYTYHGRYLVTTDGVVYAMFNGYLGKEAILVYKAGFDLK